MIIIKFFRNKALMKHNIGIFFLLAILMFFLGCSTGKELLFKDKNQISTVNTIAITGFPGQCTYEDQNISLLEIAVGRFDSLHRFEIVPIESTNEMYSILGLLPIYVDDEYSTLDVQGIAELCAELDVDAVVVGFYRIRIENEKSTTYVDEYGQTVWTTSPTYPQMFPIFEVCIIGMDGSLLLRAVSEGRKTGFWNLFWDSLFEIESDVTFYDRVQDAMDGICKMVEE